MTEIIPAVMPKNLEELAGAVAPLRGAPSFIQVDSMDGLFVPNKSWPYSAWQEFQLLAKEEGALPYWQDFNYEFDLMVENPLQVLDGLIRLGVLRVIFHIESVGEGELRESIKKSKEAEIEVGIALNNDTELEMLNPFIKEIDFVQLMGIARIGFQGENFDERVLPRIKKLREEYPNLIISIDGGVNFDTASQLTEAGASRLVSGSAIFESDNPKEAVKNLQLLTTN